MDYSEIRKSNFESALAGEPGPERGRKTRFAKRIGKSAAQISQWLSDYRGIDDKTAREIEKKIGWPEFSFDRAGGAMGVRYSPPVAGEAQDLSLLPPTVPPLKTQEELMAQAIPEEFRFALVDDAMSPQYPKGLHISFTTLKPAKPGRVVLVSVPNAGLHVRVYTQGQRPDHWLAAPIHAAYRTYNSDEGARLIGVMRGTHDPSND